MNVDHILSTLNATNVRFLLIGGMNFMLRHQPILTYDLDIWIEDSESNRLACESALVALDAEWGPTEATWGPVKQLPAGWLAAQGVVCLATPHGALDVFRAVAGLDDWQTCWNRGVSEQTALGTSYRGISDEDMLHCQTALEPGSQKSDRVKTLRAAIQNKGQQP
jgi:hypothetical protein